MAITWRNVNLNSPGAGFSQVGSQLYNQAGNRLSAALGRIDNRVAQEEADREALGLAQFQQELTNQTNLSPLDIAGAIRRFGVDPTQATTAYQTESERRRENRIEDTVLNDDLANNRLGREIDRSNFNSDMETEALARRVSEFALGQDQWEQANTEADRITTLTQNAVDNLKASPSNIDKLTDLSVQAGEQFNAWVDQEVLPVEPRLKQIPRIEDKLAYVNQNIEALENSDIGSYNQLIGRQRFSTTEGAATKAVEDYTATLGEDADITVDRDEVLPEALAAMQELRDSGESVTNEDLYVALRNTPAFEEAYVSNDFNKKTFKESLKNTLKENMETRSRVNTYYQLRTQLEDAVNGIQGMWNQDIRKQAEPIIQQIQNRERGRSVR